MDLWVVAAATGAGYLAKNLQNLPSSEKQRLAESSSQFSIHTSLESRNLLQQIREKTCPLRRLAQGKGLEDTSDEKKDGFRKRILDMEQLDGSTSTVSHSGQKMASTSGGIDNLKEDYDVLWLSSSPPGFRGRDSILHSMEFVGITDCSPFELGKFKLLKIKASTYFGKPLSSLQGGLGPQLHKEHEEVEEHVHSSVPSPCISTIRPLLITEGTENITRPETIPKGMWPNGSTKDTIKNDPRCNQENAPPSDSSPDKTNSVEVHCWTSGSTKRVPDRASHSPGSPNSMLLLMFGIITGIIATTVADGNEVTSLNEQLKQANRLVQDLQEELEMKEKLTVKDLTDEESQFLTKNNASLFNRELIPAFPEPESDKHEARENEIDSYGTSMANAKVAGDHLLTSEIEAELEAELERLELNTSVMDKTSEFSQLDLEYEAVTVPEHMKLNLLSRQYNDDSSDADYDEDGGNGTEHIVPPNYAVSPRELTIRLHEEMELRLEARIRELETALQNSQNQLQFLETECISQNMASTPESPASA